MAICVEHGQHVRVDGRLSVLTAEKSEGEADQLLFFILIFNVVEIVVEGTDKNIACRLEGNRHRERQSIVVCHTPHFLLDGFQLAEVVDAFEVANEDLGRPPLDVAFHTLRFQFGGHCG